MGSSLKKTMDIAHEIQNDRRLFAKIFEKSIRTVLRHKKDSACFYPDRDPASKWNFTGTSGQGFLSRRLGNDPDISRLNYVPCQSCQWEELPLNCNDDLMVENYDLDWHRPASQSFLEKIATEIMNSDFFWQVRSGPGLRVCQRYCKY